MINFTLSRPAPPKVVEPLRLYVTREFALNTALDLRRMLEDGVVENRAETARLRGLSRARVTQLASIAGLPQPILDCLLSLPAEQQTIYTERRLRRIVRLPTEEEQVKAFEELRCSVEAYGNWGTHPAGPRLPRSRLAQ